LIRRGRPWKNLKVGVKIIRTNREIGAAALKRAIYNEAGEGDLRPFLYSSWKIERGDIYLDGTKRRKRGEKNEHPRRRSARRNCLSTRGLRPVTARGTARAYREGAKA